MSTEDQIDWREAYDRIYLGMRFTERREELGLDADDRIESWSLYQDWRRLKKYLIREEVWDSEMCEVYNLTITAWIIKHNPAPLPLVNRKRFED